MSSPKILVENKQGFGKPVEQVALDTNQVDISAESTQRFANIIALNSRGLWVDISQWVVYSAGAYSAAEACVLMGLPAWAAVLIFGLPVFVLCVTIGAVMDRRKSLVSQGALRFVLLFIGAVLAVI